MGSPAVAALIAQVAFWVLLAVGWLFEELRPSTVAVFLVLWCAGLLAFGRVLDAAFFPSYVAVLDIILVFLVFKGDVRLT
jgi:hypothetical protein